MNFSLVLLSLLTLPQRSIGSLVGNLEMTIDPEDLLYNLHDIFNVVGFKHVQVVLNQYLHVEPKTVHHSKYLQKFVSLLEDQIGATGRLMNLLNHMCSRIEANYINLPPEAELPDCDDSGITSSYVVTTNYSTICQLVPPFARTNPVTTYVTRQIMHRLIEKYKTTNFKGQTYIGMTSGILYLYPAVQQPGYVSSSRFRPWYGTALSPPKYLILVIDVSVTMEPYFIVAKEVARIFVTSSNLMDRITVIGYSAEHVITPHKVGFCYDSYMLVEATRPNQMFLQKFIERLSVNGVSHFETVFDKIFSFLNHTIDQDRYVVFISGGPSGQDKTEVLESIRSRRTSASRSVTFVTVDIGDEKNDILKGIGEEFGRYISSEGVIEPYNYYERFIHPIVRKSGSVILSPAFVNSVTKEVVSVVTKPIFAEDQLVGVAAVEVRLSEIYREFKNLVSDTHSYVFIINKFGLICFHPRVSHLERLVHIGRIEKEALQHGVIDSMLRGGSGHKDFVIEDIISIGKLYLHGIQTTLVNATFIWRPLPTLELSVCAVQVYKGNMMDCRYWIHPPIPSRPFVYHDIIHNNAIKKCIHFHHTVTEDSSTVKFSGAAFINPSKYLNEEEFTDKTRLYPKIIKGHLDSKQFKDGIIESVTVTSVVETLWIKGGLFAIWKVLATASGVTRSYPGRTEDRRYMPVRRSWYMHSTSRPGDIIVTSPYLEPSANGFVITLSLALTVHMYPNDTRLVSFGALKVDVFVEYLYTMLLGSYTRCQAAHSGCFIVDETGYIVVHLDFLKPPSTPTSVPFAEHIHITEKECKIAEKLIQHGIMKRVACLEQTHNAVFHHYKMKEGVRIKEQDPLSNLLGVEICHVHNTNIYVVVKLQQVEAVNFDIGVCHCAHTTKRGLARCTKDPRTNTVCPCLYTTTYDTCHGPVNNMSLCPPLVESLYTRETVTAGGTELLRYLPDCHIPDCSSRNTPNECYQVAECNWCSVAVDGSPLNTDAFCARRQHCYFGMVGHYGVFNDGMLMHGVKTWKFFAVMSVVMFTSIVIVLVLVLGLIWLNHYHRRKQHNTMDIQSDLSSVDAWSRHRYSTDISELGSGFYGPYSQVVFDDINLIRKGIRPGHSYSLRISKTVSSCSPPRVESNGSYFIQKSFSTSAVLEDQRKAYIARKQQLRNIEPGEYSRRHNLTACKYRPHAIEHHKHMSALLEEISEPSATKLEDNANNIDTASA